MSLSLPRMQGPSHRLELASADDARQVQEALSTDDEDRVTHKMRNYEKTIDTLMSEVGTLKNEVSRDLIKKFLDVLFWFEHIYMY